MIRTHASDDMIAQAEADLFNRRQPPNINEERYASTLLEKALQFVPVHTEAKLKGLYIEALPDDIRQNFRSHWATNVSAELDVIARYAASVETLTKPESNPTPSEAPEKTRGWRNLVMDIEAPPIPSSSSIGEEALRDQTACDQEVMILEETY